MIKIHRLEISKKFNLKQFRCPKDRGGVSGGIKAKIEQDGSSNKNSKYRYHV